MSEWKTIDTAPRDGTHILAWNEELGARETYMGKYGKGSPGYAIWERGDGPLNCGWEWDEPNSCEIFKWNPTHWMPSFSTPKAGQ